MDDVVGWLRELWVVRGITALIEVGEVDEVPLVLPGVPLALDVVSEGSALGEWVVTLLNQIRVVLLEWSEDLEGLGKCIWCLLGKKVLSSVGDYFS